MKILNKIGFRMCDIPEYAFIVLMGMIIFATGIIDKKMDTPYANTVPYANVIYYLLASYYDFLDLSCHTAWERNYFTGRILYESISRTC